MEGFSSTLDRHQLGSCHGVVQVSKVPPELRNVTGEEGEYLRKLRFSWGGRPTSPQRSSATANLTAVLPKKKSRTVSHPSASAPPWLPPTSGRPLLWAAAARPPPSLWGGIGRRAPAADVGRSWEVTAATMRQDWEASVTPQVFNQRH
jgi:hypothetical protein